LSQLAFELHRARADDRRRALGLTALSDTATDLAAHLEVDELLAATDAELEIVDGVGDIRAKDIREGLRRLQEINLVDRYLQS